MLTATKAQNISEKTAKSGDIYRFDIDSFWDGEWVSGETKEPEESEYIRLTRKEYLNICTEVPESGCICQSEQAHSALYKLLLGRQYPHFGVTGIKTLYLIMCREGYFGEKYENITSHDAIRKLIGGRADYSHASEEFWQTCYERIKQEDVSARLPLRDYTVAEREIWRAFVRRGSISCNKKRMRKTND